MTRTITIKGVGKLSLKPDQVVVSLTLNATDKNYDKTMDTAASIWSNSGERLSVLVLQRMT